MIKTELFIWESCLCAKSCKQCIERYVSLAKSTSTANTRRFPNAVLMLGQRRRRWTDIKAALANVSCLLGQAMLEWSTAFSHLSIRRWLVYHISDISFVWPTCRPTYDILHYHSELVMRSIINRHKLISIIADEIYGFLCSIIKRLMWSKVVIPMWQWWWI